VRGEPERLCVARDGLPDRDVRERRERRAARIDGTDDRRLILGDRAAERVDDDTVGRRGLDARAIPAGGERRAHCGRVGVDEPLAVRDAPVGEDRLLVGGIEAGERVEHVSPTGCAAGVQNP
jgi:hypothetical protein